MLKSKEERNRSIFGNDNTIKKVRNENKNIEKLKRILTNFPNLKTLKDNTKSEVMHVNNKYRNISKNLEE
jgi:hypothetical protein